MDLYEESDLLTVNGNIILYAVWASVYPVTYLANGATSGSVPLDLMSYEAGDYAIIKSNTGDLLKPGYVFNGWRSSYDGLVYMAGSQYKIPIGNVTFSANWSYVGTGGTGGTPSHTYLDVGDAELALVYGMAAGTGVTSTSAIAYTTQTTSGSSLTVVYHLNGYTYSGLTLNGSITSVVSTSPTSTSTNGTVNVTGGSVTKIVYSYGSTGTPPLLELGSLPSPMARRGRMIWRPPRLPKIDELIAITMRNKGSG